MLLIKRKCYIVTSFLALLGLFLASCAPAGAPAPTAPFATSAPAPGAPTPTPAKAPAEQPRYGGIITGILYADASSFDIHQEKSTPNLWGIAGAYNGLVRFDPLDIGKISGDLAEKWEMSSDGLVYTFHLHKNVNWHDGKPFSSEDVRYNLDRIRMPPRGMISPRQDDFVSIDKVDTPDKDTVRVTLKYPQPAVMEFLAVGWSKILPKHVIEEQGNMKRDVIGTGPFKLKSYATGVGYDLVKNDDYFVKGRPYLDGVKWYIVKDKTTRLAAFRTKRALFTPSVSGELAPTQIEIMKKESPSIVIYDTQRVSSHMLRINNTRQPWNDLRVRQAVNLAIDRQAAIKIAFEGHGKLAGYVSATWGIPVEELAKLPGLREAKDKDLAEAKRLLAEAGYPQGFKTTMVLKAGQAADEKVGLFCIDQLAKIGIGFSVEVTELTVWNKRQMDKDYDTVPTAYILNVDDPDGIGYHFITNGSQNWSGFSDKRFDELYAKQSRTVDAGERRKLVLEMEKRLFELVPVLIIALPNVYVAYWPEVRNFFPNNRISYSDMMFQDTWLAK